ncbi:MAG: hypothetical protein AB7F28_03800 [Candidatus Margulisiibacteriota bacterium]
MSLAAVPAVAHASSRTAQWGFRNESDPNPKAPSTPNLWDCIVKGAEGGTATFGANLASFPLILRARQAQVVRQVVSHQKRPFWFRVSRTIGPGIGFSAWSVPGGALFFGFREYFKEHFKEGHSSGLAQVISITGASLPEATWRQFSEVGLAVAAQRRCGLGEALKHAGPVIHRGFLTLVVADISWNIPFFMGTWYLNHHLFPNGKDNIWVQTGYGIGLGGVATIINHPADLISTRLKQGEKLSEIMAELKRAHTYFLKTGSVTQLRKMMGVGLMARVGFNTVSGGVLLGILEVTRWLDT